MIISVEGLDGVGKSSLVAELSRFFKFPIIEKPINVLLELTPSQSNSIKEKIYSNYSSDIQAMYYLLGYLAALENGNTGDYILDRGFLSTYYFSFYQENADLFDFFAHTYGFPNLTFLLYASKEKRISRIQNRNSNDRDLKKERLYNDDYEKYIEAINKYNIPHITISTENLSQSEASNLAIEICNLWIKGGECRNKILDLFNVNNLSKFKNSTYFELQQVLKNSLDEQKKYVRRKWF